MRRFIPGLGCLLLLSLLYLSQDLDFGKIEIKVQKVAGNVYMLEAVNGFGGGNIGVSVGEDGILIVDDQFAPLAPKIQAALKEVSDKPVRFVLNTHWHGDHTNGNQVFGKASTIIAHENVRKRLSTDKNFNGKDSGPPPKEALPLITFDSRMTVHINGEDIRGIHFPSGHTDGDTVVYFPQSNVVHMGDDFFNGMFPFIDLESGGSVDGCITALEKVLADLPSGAKIIPGHGKLATSDELRAAWAMLKESSAIVRSGVKQGKTLDQIRKEKPLAKYDKWGWAFIKADDFVGILYNDAKGVKQNPGRP